MLKKFLEVKYIIPLISLENGMMYERDEWKQIGTIDTKEFLKTLSALQRHEFVGHIEIS